MIGNEARLAALVPLNETDRDTIAALHDLGQKFQNAVGAYMADNPAKFPAGTLRVTISPEDQNQLNALLNSRSNVDGRLTFAAMEAQSTYVGLHIHCLFMKCAEQYLQSLNVPFDDIAASVDADITDADTKLSVCERYGFAPMARLLNVKMGL